jgi:hypothetical protein
MLKEHEPPKEPVRVKAERRWRNAALRREIKEELQKPKLVDPNTPPETGDVISNDRRLDGPINRLERAFIRQIRDLMNEHAGRNLQFHAALIEHRKRILLKEKLRRLKLAQQNQGI